MKRREFLKLGDIGALLSSPEPQMQMPHGPAPSAGAKDASQAKGGPQAQGGKADFTVHIAPIVVNLSQEQLISTMGYNGIAPGPVLRMHEGVRTVVDVINDTDFPEIVHWHGMLLPAEADGATEEGTPIVPPNGRRRYIFTPRPAGTRWYHSQIVAGPNVSRGMYSGQYGFVFVEPKGGPGSYDHETFLALREWQPYFTDAEADDDDPAGPPPAASAQTTPSGYGVAYRAFSINDKIMDPFDPMRVHMGDRVLFRLLNASATQMRRLALPGHKFQVQALDGNAVPQQQAVDVVQLGPGERVDAIVEMNQPGIWILGCTDNADRDAGMGTIIQYQGQKGEARWTAPPKTLWDYTIFGNAAPGAAARPEPDQRFDLSIARVNGGKGKFNRWTVNDKSFPNTDPLKVRAGRRYRLAMKNLSGVALPMHLHRHIFELVSVDGKATAGIMKDTVVVRPYGAVEVDFVADQPGPALLQSQQQIHMDFGLMTLIEYS
jgi:FtsP/CotA-like multicopper oxidase with cupredoxin domain